MLLTEEAGNKPFLEFIKEINAHVDKLFSSLQANQEVISEHLSEAIGYVLGNGGKRFRPLLLYATGRALDCDSATLDPAAIAIELIHTYSLIHDDLPAMDDDDLRRGIPTCHKRYDEATAILVGDALQALAFEVLSNSLLLFKENRMRQLDADKRLAQIELLAKASGSRGMIAGQSLDLLSAAGSLEITALEQVHRYKTGCLIEAAVNMSVIAAGFVGTEQQLSLGHYAEKVGLLFQIQDDILDVTGSVLEIGKATGVDEKHNKATFPELLGLESAQQRVREAHDEALTTLSAFGKEADLLRALASYAAYRVK